MSVTTLSATSLTTNLSVPANTWTDVISQQTVTGTGNVVAITAYVENLDAAQTQTQILVDGTSIFQSTPDMTIIKDVVLSSGSHTIDFQVYSFITGQTAHNRALTILNLT